MKKIVVLGVVGFLLSIVTFAVAATEDDYQNTIKLFQKSAVVSKFFDSAYAYAVFPSIGKAGYIVGGSYGKGQVYRNGKVSGRSTVIEGSIGFQVGGKVFSEIIFFQDKRAYYSFASGNFEFDATAQAVVITAGAEARAGTDGSSAGASAGPKTGIQAQTGYSNGMATFVHTRGGLMYEFSIGGQKFTFSPI